MKTASWVREPTNVGVKKTQRRERSVRREKFRVSETDTIEERASRGVSVEDLGS